MTKYIEMSNGEPYAHYLCSSTVATGNDSKVLEFEYLGRTYLQPLPMRTIIQGEVYNLASNELHRVVANTEKEFAAITIMKRDVYQRNVTNVYVSLSDVKQPEASFRRANKNMPFDSKSPEIKWCIQELKNFRAY